MKTSIAEEKGYYPYIDGLRGIAILMVVLVHVTQYAVHGPMEFATGFARDLAGSGARGVQLFFMLSAFTLFASSRRRFFEDAFPKTSFYIRRAFRILPFWWIMVAVFAVMGGVTLLHTLPSIFFYFGLVRYNPQLEVVPGGWTLFVEETFYLFLPLVLLYVKNMKAALVFFVGAFLLSLGWSRLGAVMGLPASNGFIQEFPLAQWFCFAMGIVLYFAIAGGRLSSWLRRFAGKKMLVLDTAVLVALLVFLPMNYRLATGALFLLFAIASSSKTLWGKLTRTRVLVWFGGYCYSIYLFHFALLHYLEPFRNWYFHLLHVTDAPGEVRIIVYFPVVAVLCLGIGFVTFNLVEKPGVRLGKMLVRKLNDKKGSSLAIDTDVRLEPGI